MSNGNLDRIAIDDIIEAATNGVLRALEARNLTAAEFTRDNGFFVDVHVRAGAWPDPDPKPGRVLADPGSIAS
jgi:hypothetical protein